MQRLAKQPFLPVWFQEAKTQVIQCILQGYSWWHPPLTPLRKGTPGLTNVDQDTRDLVPAAAAAETPMLV